MHNKKHRIQSIVALLAALMLLLPCLAAPAAAAGVNPQAVCQLNYDGNGSGVSNVPASQMFDSTVTISSQVPVRSGYTFLGWSLNKADTAKQYDPGQTVTSGINFTLYAVWQSTTTYYTLTYHANNGSNPPPQESRAAGVSFNLSTVQPTRAGYRFLGWARANNAINAEFTSGQNVTINANTTLYAVWEQVPTFTLIYNANNGSNPPPNEQREANVPFNLSTIRPTRSGYTFAGWASSSVATKAQYQPGASVTIYGQTTIYAVWACTLTYNANGGSGGPAAEQHAVGETFALSTVKPSRSGYTFKGWAAKSTDTTAKWASGASGFSLTSNGTIYAVWEKKASFWDILLQILTWIVKVFLLGFAWLPSGALPSF